MSAQDRDDRRRFLRIPIATRIRYVHDGKEQILITEDISEGGLGLKTDNPPFANSVLQLEISLPNAPELIKVKGEVMWRQEGVGCGVRFLKVTAEQKKYIKEFIESLEDAQDSEE